MLKVNTILQLGSNLRHRQIYTGITRYKRRKTAEEKVRSRIIIKRLRKANMKPRSAGFDVRECCLH